MTEEFRRQLILDNKDYFTTKKPRKVRRPPAKNEPKYIPAQARELVARGIDLPDGIKQRHEAWLKRNFGTPGVDPSKVDWFHE